MNRRLEVLLHSQPIGELSDLPEGGTELRFLEGYLERAPRPVLGQRFEDDLERPYRSRRGQSLPDFFSNLIPEGRLREVIEEAAGLEEGDDVALLAFVGRDLPGAVAVVPAGEEDEPSAMAAATPSPDEPTSPDREAMRFSLAGVQLKFSMLLEGDKLTLPASDQSGDWIVKLDTPTRCASTGRACPCCAGREGSGSPPQISRPTAGTMILRASIRRWNWCG